MRKHVPQVVIGLACALVAVMYACNHDMAGKPDAPRGTGQYLPILDRGDGHMMYLMARSTAIDLDWVFDNDLARFGDPWNEPRTATGRKSIVHPIGPALVWTPLIWVAELGAVVVNVFGADIPLHGYTLWHQRFVFFSSVVFACLAVWLARRVALRILGGPWSTALACVAGLLGTSLTYYATYMPSYGHAMDAFASSAFLAYWALTKDRRDLRRWIVLGALLGCAALIRTQEMALGIVVIVEAIGELARGPDRRATALYYVSRGALTLGIALLVFTPQLYEWHVVFGSFTGLPQGARFTRVEAPMIGEVLFSARNGWFSTTPLAYAGCIGLAMLPRQARVIGIALLAAVLLQVYLDSIVLDWWSGSSFGQRRLCNVTLPVILGLACLLWRAGRFASRFKRPPRAAWIVVGACLLALPVAANLVRVQRLRAGKAAPDALAPTCCDTVWTPLRPTVQWFYDRIGNPFELPASLYFAWRHDVPLARWDQIVGTYPVQPSLADLKDDARFYATKGKWNPAKVGAFLVGGWSAVQHADGKTFRTTTSPDATVLVPNLMPESARVTIAVASAGASKLDVRWNGEVVATTALSATWSTVSFERHPMELHTNELSFDAGVSVGDITIELLPPP